VTIISGSSGSGNGVVTYRVDTNPSTSYRSANLTIAGQSFTVGQDGVPELYVDDGTFEVGLRLDLGGTLTGVNRLTPSSYPATLTGVQIYNYGIPFDAPFTLLIGTNPSGGTNINGVTFLTREARMGLGARFNLFSSFPDITINSGDFVIGMMIDHQRTWLPFARDTNSPSRRRSYVSTDNVSFVIVDDTGYAGNFGIRARLAPRACPTVTSINPANGTAGANVTITGTNFTGVTGVKFANNVTAIFTVNSDTAISVTVPNGAVTGPITIIKPDCRDAQTGIFALPGYEADVAPRPTGNGAVTAADWAQIGRFVAGLDTPANGGEFQRADCAPRATLGDGRLTTADWVQAGRYAAGSDPVVAAGGPMAPSGSLVAVGAQRRRAAPDGQRPTNGEMRAIGLAQAVTGEFIVEVGARGDENALGFSLQFDPSQWSFVSAATGRDAQGATLHVNATQAARGRIGVVLALPAGQRLQAGARQIVILRLAARGGRGAIEFSDYPVKREVVDAEANVTPSAFAIDGNGKHK
jgi:hypothetical protein